MLILKTSFILVFILLLDYINCIRNQKNQYYLEKLSGSEITENEKREKRDVFNDVSNYWNKVKDIVEDIKDRKKKFDQFRADFPKYMEHLKNLIIFLIAVFVFIITIFCCCGCCCRIFLWRMICGCFQTSNRKHNENELPVLMNQTNSITKLWGLDIKLNGIPVRVLLDTGSSISIISKSRMMQLNGILLNEKTMDGIVANRTKMSFLGTTMMQMSFNGVRSYPHKFRVVDDSKITNSIIFGLDSLIQLGFQINFRNKKVSIKNHNYPVRDLV
ncbi:unnamed protein product [Caenorhabditis angaria]|uniref:Peptidase A2 domain-containing protein n=1 Tax=Caenorhabditis angaria TaxID=860376 RepID=A0A9P1N7B5_9PELO|nr:unnamed protein product [Caenorhabditis angaria]